MKVSIFLFLISWFGHAETTAVSEESKVSPVVSCEDYMNAKFKKSLEALSKRVRKQKRLSKVSSTDAGYLLCIMNCATDPFPEICADNCDKRLGSGLLPSAPVGI